MTNRRSDYDKESQSNFDSGIWIKIKHWLSGNYHILFNLIFIIILFTGIYFLSKHDVERIRQQELNWTTNDSTFVEKQDDLYIYHRMIDGGEYYFITNHKHGKFKINQIIPVVKNSDTIKIPE